MSRAININATEAELSAICAQLGIGYSVIEPLKSGGSRLVMNNSMDAGVLRGKCKKMLIDGPVERSPSHVSRQHIPYL